MWECKKPLLLSKVEAKHGWQLLWIEYQVTYCRPSLCYPACKSFLLAFLKPSRGLSYLNPNSLGLLMLPEQFKGLRRQGVHRRNRAEGCTGASGRPEPLRAIARCSARARERLSQVVWQLLQHLYKAQSSCGRGIRKSPIFSELHSGWGERVGLES